MGNVNRKYIDKDNAIARVGGNEELYCKLLEKVKSSIDIAELEKAFQSQDYVKAGEIVHVAKGIAGNLSLEALYLESALLMNQLREGNAPMPEAIERFKECFESTVEAVREYLS